MTHDDLCPFAEHAGDLVGRQCRCALIARVRADERERMADEPVRDAESVAAAYYRREALADLRAKVDDLRERASQGQDSGWQRDEHRVGQEYAYEAVLALIDEDAP